MNFYRDFIAERLKDIEDQLSEAAEALEVPDDDQINTPQAMAILAKIVGTASLAQSMLSTMAAATVYKIGATYMQQDAVMIDDLAQEAEAVAEIGKVAIEDVYAAHNPAPLGIGHGYTHPAYPRILSRIPIRHIHRLGPHGLFNGCLFRHGDESLFACRTQGFPSRTSIYRPNEDVLFADPKEVKLPESFRFCSVEDMRIVRHAGKNLASFTVAGQTEKGWMGNIVLAEINEDRELILPQPIESPTDSHLEKNWAFFSHEGKLFCVYTTAPHVVYEVVNRNAHWRASFRCEAENWQSANFMENARGGAPPVRVGDEYYHFYHSQHRHGHGTAYQTGLYTFEAKPPWNIRRVVRGPLLGLVPSKRPADVLFVMGAILDKGRWLLSAGLMDQETVGISLGFEDVERLLEAMATK